MGGSASLSRSQEIVLTGHSTADRQLRLVIRRLDVTLSSSPRCQALALDRRQMTNSELTSDVRAFLDDYNEAFASIDGHRIADLYHLPTVTMRGDGSIHCFQSRAELATFFQGVADTYQRDGYAGGRFDDLHVSPIGSRSALATLDWKMARGDGSLIRKWRQSYNLVRGDSGWRILVSTFHLPDAVPAA